MKSLISQIGIKTLYKFYGVNKVTNARRELSGWCGNTILTNGKNQLSTLSTWAHTCQVGTDNTTPVVGQTGLLGYIAGSSNIIATTQGAESTAPYFGWKRRTFRFEPDSGIANENLSEVGTGWSTASGDTLVARSLIVDVFGVGTTITPLVDEWLDVLVEVRYYPPLVDTTGTVVLDGVTYDYIIRAANVTSQSFWAGFIGEAISSYAPAVSSWQAFDDDIGTILTGPSGVSYNSDNSNNYNLAYSSNSYELQFGLTTGITGWNATTNKLLRSVRILTTAGEYQIQFDSQSNPGFGIPKTTAHTLALQFIISWTEATIP